MNLGVSEQSQVVSERSLPPGRWVIGSGIGLAAALMALVIALCVIGRPIGRRLPDGTRLALLGSTFGAPATVRTGTLLARAGAAVVGTDRPFPGTDLLTLAGRPGELVLGFRRSGADPRLAAPLYFELSDGHGGRIFDWGMPREIDQELHVERAAWGFSVFPRRGQTIHIAPRCLLPDGTWATGTPLEIANPAPGPFPIWKPDPPTTIRRAGELTAQSISVEYGVPLPQWPLASLPWPAELRRGVRARFQLAGAGAEDWEPIAATLSDPTGNVTRPLVQSRRCEGGLREIVLRHDLLTSEPLWRIDLEIGRRRNFAPGETYTFRGIPLPRGGTVRFSNRTVSSAMSNVELTSITAGALTRDGRQVGATHTVTFSWTLPRLTGYRLRPVRVVDDQGRTGRFGGGIAPTPGLDEIGGEWHDMIPIIAPPGARSVDVTFAVSLSRTVTFVMSPRLYSAK